MGYIYLVELLAKEAPWKPSNISGYCQAIGCSLQTDLGKIPIAKDNIYIFCWTHVNELVTQ